MTLKELISFLSEKTDNHLFYIINKSSISAKDIDIIKEFYENGCCNEIYKKDNLCTLGDISEGDDLSIHVYKRKLRIYGYYHDIENYLTDKIDGKVKTDIAYIEEISSYSNQDIEILKKIEFAMNIKAALLNTYDIDTNGNLLIQCNDIRKIAPTFEKDSLDGVTLNEEAYRALKALEIDTDLTHTIYKQALSELYDQYSNEAISLSNLFNHFHEYIYRCHYSIRLYLKNFSFRDTKAQIDKTISEFADKTQNIVTSTQSRLIALPAAFILGICSLDHTTTWSIRNCSILLGSIFFALIIWIFIKNQMDSLKTLKSSIQNYKELVKSEFTDNETELSIRFKELDKQITDQETRLNIINVITWLIPILTGFVISKSTLFCMMMEKISQGVAWIVALIPGVIKGVL